MAATNDDPRTVRRWLALGLATGFAVGLTALIARTAAAGFMPPLPTWQIALWSAVGCAVSMAAWRLDDEDRTGDDAPARTMRAAIAVIGTLLFGLLSARGNGTGIAIVAGISFVATAMALVRVLQLREPLIAALTPSRNTAVSESPSAIAPSISTTGASGSVTMAGECEIDESLTFQLRRSSTPDGETIEAQARLPFPPGARESTLHIPFWPALSTDPEVDCEPLDGDEVDLKIASAERYGIRLEARLPSPATESRTVMIGIEIRAAAADGEMTASIPEAA